jgi:CheY-like chemotaxis protein
VRQKILYFGCYEPLAEARKLLLEQLGFDTRCAKDPSDAVRMVHEEKIALIVVCNSCDDTLCEKLFGALLLGSVSVPTLRLDEQIPAAWRDPEVIASLIRASLRGTVNFGSKPPQAEHGSRIRNSRAR